LHHTGRWEGELLHTKRDGSQITVASRWSLQRDEQGQPVATLETNNDITQRKGAEAALRDSEERYRGIFEGAGVSIWEEDFSSIAAVMDRLKAQGVVDFRRYLDQHPEFVRHAISMVRILDVNDATPKLLGAGSKDELLVSLDRVFLPETEEVFAGELLAMWEGQTFFESETVLRALTGEKLAVMFTVTFPPPPARFDRVLVSIMDVTGRRRAEETLRERANLLDLTHDTVFVRDLNDVITYWNRGAEELYGWSREEAIGRVSHELTQTIFPAPLQEINETLRRTGRWEGELVHTKRDGTRVTVASRWSLQRDARGNPAGTLETNNDVTQRKRAELALRRSEAYLAEAQRLSHTGSWAVNPQRHEERYWSDEMYRIFGLDPAKGPPDLIVGQQRPSYMHPDDWPRVQHAIQAAIRDKTNVEFHCRAVLPEGSTRYVYAIANPVVNAEGEVVEIVGTVMDLTERKLAERALRRARERALKVRFDAVLDERTRLAREIHDTLLQGFTGVALQLVAVTNRLSGPPEIATALRDVVSLAQKTLQDARRAVWDLRTPSFGGSEFATALRAVAEDCVRGRELTLEYRVEGPARALDPDVEAAASRVVQEALANVVKHAAASSVRVRLSYEARGMRLSVTDDGRGFVVDPDFRTYGGHWGLLGMRERATQIEGKLRVRSTPGQGTKVVLLVPYQARPRSLTPSAATT
jgi:PAS domain S-box-containing protein